MITTATRITLIVAALLLVIAIAMQFTGDWKNPPRTIAALGFCTLAAVWLLKHLLRK